jgi:hypothetical protein
MEKLNEQLSHRNIAGSTIKMYIARIKILKKAIDPNGDSDSLDFLKDSDKVIKYVNTLAFAKKKISYTACMAALSPESKDTVPKEVLEQYTLYRKQLLDLNKELFAEKSKQLKTSREEENWLDWKDILKLQALYKKKIKDRGYNQSTEGSKSEADKELMQKLLVISLYTLHPPRRLEYGTMIRISETNYNNLDIVDKQSHNYIVSTNKKKVRYFSFGDVKSNNKSIIRIPINNELNKIINMWFNMSTSSSFLTNTRGDPQTSNGLSKFIIDKVFDYTDKKVGANMLRHIFLTNKYKNDTALKDKLDTAKMMNHSPATADLYYIKKG